MKRYKNLYKAAFMALTVTAGLAVSAGAEEQKVMNFGSTVYFAAETMEPAYG